MSIIELPLIIIVTLLFVFRISYMASRSCALSNGSIRNVTAAFQFVLFVGKFAEAFESALYEIFDSQTTLRGFRIINSPESFLVTMSVTLKSDDL